MALSLPQLVAFLTRVWPRRHSIALSSGHGPQHFGFAVRAKWWPPFAATDFLAPRYEIRITNPGEPIEGLRLQVAVAPYKGSLEELPQLNYQWRPVVEYRHLGPMGKEQSRTTHVTIPTGVLDEGTRVVRLHLMVGTTKGVPPGQTHYSSATFAWLREYLRVEPLSSVLTLLVAVGTLLTAAATLAIVLLG